jgi:glutamate synthase (NADPH/NADH) small chain
MWYIEQGDFLTAAAKFWETSNFPDVCGRICPQEKQCEGNCVVSGKERAVTIGKLESFVIDYVRKNYGYPPRPKAPETGMRVGIVGSGPAGLAVAEELTVLGHTCTVFEQWPKPGGLLLYGIPNFKLNKELVKDKIKYLEDMGITFICNARIGKERPIEYLVNEGFDLVFLGHGAIKGGGMKVPGEDTLKNIYQATEYLVRGNCAPEDLPPELRTLPHVGQRTIVVGGGDTGMDCVRTAKRLNPDGEVWCVYRRTEVEMPGRGEERVHAKEEGIKFEWLTLPVRFIGDENGCVKAAECIRMKLGAPDAKGRRTPVPIEGSNFILECDTVALAIGYSVEPEIAETTPLKTTRWGTIWVKNEEEGADSGLTSREEVYAAGDNVRGADLVVTAVAAARYAAASMHQRLMDIKERRYPQIPQISQIPISAQSA